MLSVHSQHNSPNREFYSQKLAGTRAVLAEHYEILVYILDPNLRSLVVVRTLFVFVFRALCIKFNKPIKVIMIYTFFLHFCRCQIYPPVCAHITVKYFLQLKKKLICSVFSQTVDNEVLKNNLPRYVIPFYDSRKLGVISTGLF